VRKRERERATERERERERESERERGGGRERELSDPGDTRARGGAKNGAGPESCTFTVRGTSLIRKRLPLGPHSSPMPRALWWS